MKFNVESRFRACNSIFRESILTTIVILILSFGSLFSQNNALQFDGSNDRITGTMSTLPQGNAARTIEAWIKNSAGNDMTIFNYGTNQNNQTFTLHLYNGVYIIGYNNDINTGFAVNNGSWHHLAVTHDGTTTKVYVDGVERGSKTTTYNTTGTNFQIGASLRSAYQFHYNGTIDEVRVWNVARTQSQIQAAMNSEISSASGLIASFHFNQGTASGDNNSPVPVTTLIDDVGGNNGTLNNFDLTGGSTSNWVAGNSTVLPVEFISFNVKNTEGGNLLKWQTATEINSSHFDIERSYDGISFNKIGEISALGKAGNYQFTDDAPLNVSYYRIRAIDFDKKETLSKIVSILNTKSENLKLYPSVATDFINIETKEAVGFVIVNLLGQQAMNGITTQQIDISGLKAGTYFIKIGKDVSKFVKQ